MANPLPLKLSLVSNCEKHCLRRSIKARDTIRSYVERRCYVINNSNTIEEDFNGKEGNQKNWNGRPDDFRVDVMIDSNYPHAAMSTADLSAYNNNLCGKILTIIDATGIDNNAKKAVKDLVKQSFYQQFDIVHHWMQYDAKREKDFPFSYTYDIKPSDYQP